MVAPLLAIGAIGSIAQGVLGFMQSKDQGDAADQAARLRVQTANQQAGISEQSISLSLSAARDAGRLSLQAAGLEIEAAGIDMEGIAQQSGSDILATLLDAGNTAREYERNSETALRNAAFTRIRAKRVVSGAKETATDFEKAAGAKLANNRAMRAASGLTNEGSPMLVDTAIIGEIMLGAARIRHAGDVQYFDHVIEAESLERAASDDKITAGFVRDAAQLSVSNIEGATQIRLKAAMLGYKAAQLHQTAATQDIDYATQKAAIDRQTVNLQRTGTIANAKLEGRSAKSNASFGGFSSLIGGVTGAVSTLATRGTFG